MQPCHVGGSTSIPAERARSSRPVIDNDSEDERQLIDDDETGHEIRTGKLHGAVYFQCLKCFCSMNFVLWRKS